MSENSVITTHHYQSGYQYENGNLQFFPHAEGYVNVVSGTVPAYNYVYQYKDHLGNNRLNYATTTQASQTQLTILEESHYYPFGLKHAQYNSDHYQFIPPANGNNVALLPAGQSGNYQYKLNGNEWQDELGLNMYDMDMRQYDPAIARWVVQDPVIHHNMSPYNTFDNNPVFWKDPSGADGERYDWDRGEYVNSNGDVITYEQAFAAHGLNPNGMDINPFSTDDLFALAAKNGVTDKMEAGNAFERAALDYLNLNSNNKLFGSKERAARTGGKYKNVIPDAVSDIDVYTLFEKFSHKDSHFHEIKAVTGWLNLETGSSEYQVLGLIDAVATSTEGGGAGRSILTLYTTSNTRISPDVISYAASKRVTLKWAVAYMSNNLLYFTPPLTISNNTKRPTASPPVGIPQFRGAEIKF
ncbi:RHS repeat-associated core domain-containing protein [Flavobacterium cucumis]